MTTKKKERIQKIIVSAIAVGIVGAALYNNAAAKKGDEALRSEILSAEYDLSDKSVTNISYADYLAGHSITTDTVGESVYVTGTDFADNSLEASDELEFNTLLTGDKGKVSYELDVPKSGYYTIDVTYMPTADSEKNIKRNLYINDEVPFEQALGICFERQWEPENKEYLMKCDKNQASPSQVQKPGTLVKSIDSADKTVDGPFLFYFEKGTNKITLESVEASMAIEMVTLTGTSGLKSYEEYLKDHASDPKVEAAALSDNGLISVQAEDVYSTTHSMTVAVNDRTSPLTVPYHSSNIVLNTIGGTSWQDAGMGITWSINVPKSGLYRLGARFSQAENRDFYSIRELKINGEVPFKEASLLKFDYDNAFQTAFFSSEEGDAYYFYLDEGINTLSMTVTMGDLSYAYEQTRISVKNFNALYKDLTAVMGSEPDEYRDYNIVSMIPDMPERLKTEYARLASVMSSLDESMEKSTKTREIAKMLLQIEDLINKPDKISKQLKTFNDNITAISEWMLSLDSQPLTLDYIFAAGEGAKLPRAEAGFGGRLVHNVKAFIGSFTNDYKVSGGSEKDGKTLEVWISTSTRDQYDILERLIERGFSEADYKVDLKMVNADSVMPATLTGNGPDVAIQLNYSLPTNFAYRNAGYDLTQFEDYEEVASQFSDAALEYFEYEGGTYALPDGMSFPVLFYRKDILEEMGLEVPTTWEELEGILPYLQAENMSAYFTTTDYRLLGGLSSSSTKPVNSVFASLLYQNGLELYRDGDTATSLDQLDSLLIFKKWTEYYTRQDFEVAISPVTRFRTGEVPIMVHDYTYVNDIRAAAPEIDGQWDIAVIPGTKDESGNIDHSVAVTVSGAMILKNSVEKNDTANEAWDFLKWWVSGDTQTTYATEQKSILGDAGNYPVANLDSMLEMAENNNMKDAFEDSLKWARGIPQAPGGYITGRYVENAFLNVVNDNTDPVDTLYNMTRYINQEITNKRKEFGLSR